jgi:hypothetical protein
MNFYFISDKSSGDVFIPISFIIDFIEKYKVKYNNDSTFYISAKKRHEKDILNYSKWVKYHELINYNNKNYYQEGNNYYMFYWCRNLNGTMSPTELFGFAPYFKKLFENFELEFNDNLSYYIPRLLSIPDSERRINIYRSKLPNNNKKNIFIINCDCISSNYKRSCGFNIDILVNMICKKFKDNYNIICSHKFNFDYDNSILFLPDLIDSTESEILDIQIFSYISDFIISTRHGVFMVCQFFENSKKIFIVNEFGDGNRLYPESDVRLMSVDFQNAIKDIEFYIKLNNPCHITTSDFCLFFKLKFELINNLKYYDKLIKECVENKIPVYIWSDTNNDLPIIYDVIYYNNKNKLECYENTLNFYFDHVGLIHMRGHALSHLKSFFLTKEEYIINIDGDDMFYPWMTLEHIKSLVKFMKSENYDILTKPHWIVFDRGWSFGFTAYNRKILPDIIDFKYNSDFYKKNNLDKNKMFNLDNWFGAILNDKYKNTKLYFSFEDNEFWDYSIYFNEKNITPKLIKNIKNLLVVVPTDIKYIDNKEILIEDNVDYCGNDIFDIIIDNYNIQMINQLIDFFKGIGFVFEKEQNKIYIKK